jgi:hypothetical protein
MLFEVITVSAESGLFRADNLWYGRIHDRRNVAGGAHRYLGSGSGRIFLMFEALAKEQPAV